MTANKKGLSRQLARVPLEKQLSTVVLACWFCVWHKLWITKAELQSVLEKKLASANLPKLKSTERRECASWRMFSFNLVRSTHFRTSPLGFGVTTTGEHQGVGSSALYRNHSHLKHFFNLFFGFLKKWQGYFAWNVQWKRFQIFYQFYLVFSWNFTHHEWSNERPRSDKCLSLSKECLSKKWDFWNSTPL